MLPWTICIGKDAALTYRLAAFPSIHMRLHKGIQLPPVHREVGAGIHWLTGKPNSKEWDHSAEMFNQLSWQQQSQVRTRVKKSCSQSRAGASTATGHLWLGEASSTLAQELVGLAPCSHTSIPAAKMSQHMQKHHANEMMPGSRDLTRLTSAGLALDQGQLPH